VDKTLRLRVMAALRDKLSAPLKKLTGSAATSAASVAALRTRLRELESTQRKVGRFDELRRGLPQMRTEMSAAQQKVRELAAQMSQTAHPSGAMIRAFEKARNTAAKLKTQQHEQVVKLRELRGQLGQAGVSTRKLAEDSLRLKSGIAQTTEALRAQSAQLEKITQRQRQLASAREQMKQSMMSAGAAAATGAGARMTGLHLGRNMTRVLHVGYEFDAQMSAVQSVTRIADKNDPAMVALREQAKTLPLSSKFTDLEVAQGQFFLGRTGYSADEIQAAMPHMLTLAAAGDMDLATTADIASNIQTAMNIPRNQMGRVADVLAAMFTRNNVDIQMMGQALKYSAVVGKDFGQSFESVAAATAMLGNAGIQADMAGTTMRQILMRIGSSKKMAELGIKTHDEDGNMRQLPDLLVDIGQVTGEMGNVLRGEIFKDIADQRSVAAMSTLIAKAQTGELQKMIAVAYNAQGEAAALAKRMNDNLKGDFSFLLAALQNISIELFDQNNPWLREWAQRLTDFAHGVGEFLKQHPLLSKAIVGIGLGLAGLLTVFGSLTFALASLLGPFIILRYASSVLGLRLFPKLTGQTSALGRAARWLARTAFAWLSRAFWALAQAAMWLARTALPWLVSALMALGKFLLRHPLLIVAGLLIYYWRSVWAFLKAMFGGLLELLKLLARAAIWAGEQMVRAFDAVVDFLAGWSPLALFKQAFGLVTDWLEGDLLAQFWDMGAALIDGLIGGIFSMAKKLKDGILSIASSVANWFKEKLGIATEPETGPGVRIAARSHPDTAYGQAALVRQTLAKTGTPQPFTLADTEALATSPRFDTRPVLAAQPAPVTVAGDTITLHINVQGSHDAQDIARAVEAVLQRRERERAARLRSSLRDTGLGALP